jgi:hypothetical protein
MSETAHLKPGANIMTTLAHTTQISGGNAKRVFIGSAGKAATAVAVVGMISVFAVGLLSSAPFTPAATMDLAHQSELRDLLCRIDHRCPTKDLAARQASRIKTAENAAR